MPRSSLADRLERTSLSRGSIGKASLGRYSIGSTDISVGSAATRHWVNSVSDIYGPDEIEELLEDLNRLELAAFETDDIQDFDIDGSQVGGRRRGGRRGGAAGGATSPTFSESSWDSHAVYQHYKEEGEVDCGGGGGVAGPVDEGGGGGVAGGGDDGLDMFLPRSMQAILCYCDTSTLKTPRTLLRVLLLVRALLKMKQILSH